MEFFKKHKITTILLFILSIYIYYYYTRITPLNNNIDKSSYHYVNELYYSDGRIYNNYLTKTEKKMYDLLFQSIKKNIHTLNISINGSICKDETDCYKSVLTAYDAIYVDHPELLEFGGIKRISIKDNNMRVNISYSVNPLFAKIGTEKIKRIVYDIKQATKNMDDITKIDYVYNWVAKNTRYDQTFTFSSKNQSAYSAFLHKEAVCAGFAKASQIIFQNIGINSYCVLGTSTGPHMWNIIEYKGKYYYYDSTVASATYKDKSGLIQEKMNYYIMNHKEWYPEVETTRIRP